MCTSPPTPGSPRYGGRIDHIYESAISDAEIFLRHGVDALIVENFRDAPFHPGTVPAETTATVAGVTREIVRMSDVPTGVAVLRNDASAALAIATATGADFIRVNVHIGAVLSEQGILAGNAHETLRLRRALESDVAIFADAGVKHSQPFVYGDLATEVRDLSHRADGIIVSGELTGVETSPEDLLTARAATAGPLLVGSGVTPENLAAVFAPADGFIVGGYFKVDGVPGNPVDESRVAALMDRVRSLRRSAGVETTETRAR
ncbi:BtpA/SgcQ family protein [Streptomyces mirabilis]|uniref:BtpA/SgcQ family protein n=1 Tax=Streptomyces mirabilis TaxID=68239 RepID=UPI002E2DA681|nr:BtpA/SgcQ family protein [Streptomyces mirabilis]